MARKKMDSPTRDPLREEFDQELPVKLSDEALIQRSDERQKEGRSRELLLSKFAKVKSQHKDDLALVDAKIRKLDETLETHTEKKLVKCERITDLEHNSITEKVISTGEVISGPRTMTAEERQDVLESAQTNIPMPGDDAGAPAAEA